MKKLLFRVPRVLVVQTDRGVSQLFVGNSVHQAPFEGLWNQMPKYTDHVLMPLCDTSGKPLYCRYVSYQLPVM